MGGRPARQTRPRPWTCKAVVLEATERLRIVLVPALGPNLATERANNIAQALLLDGTEIEATAHAMLRDLPEGPRRLLARQVSAAWSRSRS